jgi:hypothetical protein
MSTLAKPDRKMKLGKGKRSSKQTLSAGAAKKPRFGFPVLPDCGMIGRLKAQGEGA